MNVRLRIAECPSNLDSPVSLAARTARRRIDEVAGIASKSAQDHEHGVRQSSSHCGMVFEIEPPLRVFVYKQRVAPAFFELRLVVGKDTIDSVGCRVRRWPV